MFEFFSAWRYLYNPQKHPVIKRLLPFSLAVCLAGLLLFWLAPKTFQFSGVILFSIGALITLTLALLFFFSVFTTISIASVLIGTMVITIVWCVSSGFQREFKEKILGVNGHILIMTYGTPFNNYKEPLAISRSLSQVEEAAPFNLNEMLAIKGEKHSGILVKGIRPAVAKRVLDLPKQLLSGSISDLDKNADYSPDREIPPEDDSEETKKISATGKKNRENPCQRADNKWPGIILGKGLAKKLKVSRGDSLTIISPLSQFSLSHGSDNTAPKVREIEFCVVGIFYAGFEEYDQKLAYAHLKVTRHFNPMVPDGAENIFGLEMRLTNMDDADIVANVLRARLGQKGHNLRVVTWS
ncbi:ABC transporter permease, partial [Myxococcota bacterium]|nr:ABC transporter permease [Myxococcota bacterium]